MDQQLKVEASGRSTAGDSAGMTGRPNSGIPNPPIAATVSSGSTGDEEGGRPRLDCEMFSTYSLAHSATSTVGRPVQWPGRRGGAHVQLRRRGGGGLSCASAQSVYAPFSHSPAPAVPQLAHTAGTSTAIDRATTSMYQLSSRMCVVGRPYICMVICVFSNRIFTNPGQPVLDRSAAGGLLDTVQCESHTRLRRTTPCTTLPCSVCVGHAHACRPAARGSAPIDPLVGIYCSNKLQRRRKGGVLLT